MQTIRTKSWLLLGPIAALLVMMVPLAMLPAPAFATFTTGTNKTIGGGFTGGTVAGATVFTPGVVTFGTAQDAANAVMFNETAGCITFEGTVADANEGRLCWPSHSGDYTVNLPLGGPSTDTIATLAQANTFTATQNTPALVLTGGGSLSWGTGVSLVGGMGGRTELTPDAPILYTGTTSNSMHFEEVGDATFDFQNCSAGTSAATDPTFCIHSHNQNTTQWIDFKHDGTNGVIDVGTGVVSIPDGATIGGGTLTAGVVMSMPFTYGVGGSVTTMGGLGARNELTPDGPTLYTGSTSNSMHFEEVADASFDFNNAPAGTAAATNPQFIVHDKDQNTTDYQSLGVSGISGSFRVTLTESSATAVVQIPVAASAGTGGTFNYCVFAADATDQQIRCSRIKFAVSNKAGTETCGLNTDTAVANDASITETEDGNAASLSTGTLTYAIACDTAPTNAVNITINAVSSLTQTTLQARGHVLLVGPGEPLPQ